ncbi:MAG TPA: Gfo/Idh/MocA family oxidoreductase [Thermodesulfovibrionales bacterium]|nr:Gfo/Idh/MocA family oxidoreductase [Thermodesulfovibrionales bacterium]
MPLRIGIIGVGYLGQHHARIFAGLENVELVGVADADGVRSQEVAAKYGCASFGGWKELAGQCDAVSIVTPTTTHYGIASACLRAGKDVFIEKPITENLEEAWELIREADAGNRILQVGHLEPYNPAIVAASGLVHEPRFIEAERLSPFLGRGTDVDITLDLMIHDIDIVTGFVQSAVRSVSAAGDRVLTGKIDAAKAWIEFENGCKALVTASRLATEKVRMLKVHQQDTFISIDYQTQEVRKYFKDAGGIAFDVIRPENREPLREELKDFVSCVLGRSCPRVSGREAAQALEIVLKINEMLKQ